MHAAQIAMISQRVHPITARFDGPRRRCALRADGDRLPTYKLALKRVGGNILSVFVEKDAGGCRENRENDQDCCDDSKDEEYNDNTRECGGARDLLLVR